jgi:hypothetical protein
VANDNAEVFHKLRLQIAPNALRAHFVRSTVKVRQYPDGIHATFRGPRCIARYNAHGALRAALGMAHEARQLHSSLWIYGQGKRATHNSTGTASAAEAKPMYPAESSGHPPARRPPGPLDLPPERWPV